MPIPFQQISAEKTGNAYCLAHLSSCAMEDVAKHSTDKNPFWIQLYMYQDKMAVIKFIERAEQAGYKAIVLTVDAAPFGRRISEWRHRFNAPAHISVPNLEASVKRSEPPLSDGLTPYRCELFHQLEQVFSVKMVWKDIAWLKTITQLPIIVKGIISPDDADRAIDQGADAIYVSNHGGRQLDSVPATLDALSLVAMRVNGRVPILFDGGIRHGSDVLKALALGANMVLLGRPVLFGLTMAGSKGVDQVFEILERELIESMKMSGIDDVNDVPRSMIAHRSNYAIKS